VLPRPFENLCGIKWFACGLKYVLCDANLRFSFLYGVVALSGIAGKPADNSQLCLEKLLIKFTKFLILK